MAFGSRFWGLYAKKTQNNTSRITLFLNELRLIIVLVPWYSFPKREPRSLR